METKNQVGNYLFVIGVIISLVLGLAAQKVGAAYSWLLLMLVATGMLVGAINISSHNSKNFLWFTAALLVIQLAGSAQVSSWADLNIIGFYLKETFDAVLAFIVPAGVVVALKEIWALAKGQRG